VEYGGGITNKTTGSFMVHSSGHNFKGPASVSPEGALKATQMDFDQKIQLFWEGSGAPIKNRAYRLHLEDGRVLSGTTDGKGYAQQAKSELGFARYRVELLPPAA
jgi:uncharacterized protein (DUF2345 family)